MKRADKPRPGDWGLAGRWPKWLDGYAVSHPLHSTGYDVYKAEFFAREARRYDGGRRLLVLADESLEALRQGADVRLG